MKTVVIAVDFESAGYNPSIHGFTQLGAVIYDLGNSKIISKFNEYASMTGYEWDKRCVDEFWMKYPEILTKTYEKVYNPNTPSPYEVIAQFWEWVKKHTEGCKDSVYIITDNAAFDIGILRHFSKQDIMYVFGTYREIIDVSCIYMGLHGTPTTVELMNKSAKKLALEAINLKAGTNLELPTFDVQHTHDAVDDATVMALYWDFFQKQLLQSNKTV